MDERKLNINDLQILIDNLIKENDKKRKVVSAIKILIIVTLISRLIGGISQIMLFGVSSLISVLKHISLISIFCVGGVIYIFKCKKGITNIENKIQYLNNLLDTKKKEMVVKKDDIECLKDIEREKSREYHDIEDISVGLDNTLDSVNKNEKKCKKRRIDRY